MYLSFLRIPSHYMTTFVTTYTLLFSFRTFETYTIYYCYSYLVLYRVLITLFILTMKILFHAFISGHFYEETHKRSDKYKTIMNVA